jgi:ABC-type transport system involved in multi-copper enzyme maturation permease subunit
MSGIAVPKPTCGPLAHLLDVMRSELCKLRSVRSTYWALLAALAFNVVLAALLAIFLPGQLSAHEKATLDTTRVSLGGMHLSQVAFGLLGVLVISSEYSAGTIRATLAAVPQRRLMLAAKTIVFAATALIAGILSCFAAYFVFQAFVSAGSLSTSLADPGVLRAVVGGGLYLTALGLFGLGLGAIMRSSAGAVATLLGLLFVPPILLELLPHSLKESLNPYVPMEAGSAIFSVHHDAGTLRPWAGFGVFCVYVAVALACAFVLIKRRDA